MATRRLKAKAVRVVCNNCFQQTIGFRDETGMIKYRCSPLRRADCVEGNGQKACAIRYVRTARARAYG